MNRPPIGPASHLPYQAPRSNSGTVNQYASSGNRVGFKAVPIGWQGTGFDDAHDQLDVSEDVVVCRIKVQIESPKRLTVNEFKDLKGSLLYGRMFKNRIILHLEASQLGAMGFLKEVDDWLETNCGAFYCRDERTLYFERSSEAVTFHLRFHGGTEEARIKNPDRPSW